MAGYRLRMSEPLASGLVVAPVLWADTAFAVFVRSLYSLSIGAIIVIPFSLA